MISNNNETSPNEQIIYLNTSRNEPYVDKKQARIELRALKDALPLNVVLDNVQKEEIPRDIGLKKVSAYCISDRIHLKNLYKRLQDSNSTKEIAMCFGECLYNAVKVNNGGEDDEVCDVFYFDYGVVVFWGMSTANEAKILKNIRPFEEGRYSVESIENEVFSYGIVTENPRVTNDIIFLSSDHYFNKMVISNPIAQSVKLDYFEKIVEDTIDNVKDLPEEIENEGKVGKTRKEVLKMVGRLHRLRFNLNLISNILDEPEILWHHPQYTKLYQSFNHYLEIKPRTGVLNQRCNIIQSILEILSENINIRNSEYSEKMMVGLNILNLIVGIIIIVVLCLKLSK